MVVVGEDLVAVASMGEVSAVVFTAPAFVVAVLVAERASPVAFGTLLG